MIAPHDNGDQVNENNVTAASAKMQPVYSIVAPVFNEEETLPHFYTRMIQVMDAVGEPFELILINDGSSDGTFA